MSHTHESLLTLHYITYIFSTLNNNNKHKQKKAPLNLTTSTQRLSSNLIIIIIKSINFNPTLCNRLLVFHSSFFLLFDLYFFCNCSSS
ncbi:hypothetical protein QVD17_00649 [Tagetes erecta]|uniref:Uncharacterized protein n=1 Tax=Tagetes erecta TaxID=13708 RepID=A0AAD8P0Q5_TARER|nr:hypothetical protein QVD17_00649 [Tagetes erecta]